MRLASLVIATLALLALAPAPALAATGSGLKVVMRIPGPDGGWDYASFDAARRRVYVAHGNVVLAVNADTEKLNPAFAAGDGLHEVLPIPGSSEILTTNSGDDTAKILRASNGSLIAALPVAADADAATYDPATGLAVVVNGAPGLLTLVDVPARKVVGTIKVDGRLEFAATDGKGRLYVNVVDKGQVAVVNLKARKVTGYYAMKGCGRPTGLAYVLGGRLVSSCASGVAMILDAATGRQIAALKIGGFPDAVLYDPVRRLAMIPTALDGRLNVIALSGPHDNTIIDRVPTQIGARTGAVDPKTGRVWLPTATYNLPVPPGQRPTTKPGTFRILVLDRR
ncbi:MAG TPA: hypothetical protein VMU93_09310 [Caulobacteraceae bacterium]|nr:hypothetical protein [Caulobacteraceae bacterium]